jgi:DNA (cytosine-5)-methyltransferase 1
MYTIELFCGAGGGALGSMLLGHTPICAVEIEEYPRKVLLQRQLDGILPAFPIWDDIKTFRSDNPETEELFNMARGVRNKLVISGGFTCQDISAAGKGAGIGGDRSGLWSEMFRIIGEIRPRYVFAENSPMLSIRGLDRVVADIASLGGYTCRWGVLGACHAGAPHRRDRIWILADSNFSP